MTEEEFLDSLLDRLAGSDMDAWEIDLVMTMAEKFYQLLEKYGYSIMDLSPPLDNQVLRQIERVEWEPIRVR